MGHFGGGLKGNPEAVGLLPRVHSGMGLVELGHIHIVQVRLAHPVVLFNWGRDDTVFRAIKDADVAVIAEADEDFPFVQVGDAFHRARDGSELSNQLRGKVGVPSHMRHSGDGRLGVDVGAALVLDATRDLIVQVPLNGEGARPWTGLDDGVVGIDDLAQTAGVVHEEKESGEVERVFGWWGAGHS